MIDFREIADPEVFEDLVAELLNRQAGVVSVAKTGRGTDAEIDIKVIMTHRSDPLSQTDQQLSGIVQCKHLATSGKAVRKGEIHPADALMTHNADVYLLATSTRVGSFYGQVLQQISKDPRYRGQHAVCWDCARLEQELLKPGNEDLLRRFFPQGSKSALRDRKRRTDTFELQKSEIARDSTISPMIKAAGSHKQETTKMREAYLITGMTPTEPAGPGALHYLAQQLGIAVTSSADSSLEAILTMENAAKHRKRIGDADGVFAVITRKSALEPNVWIEVERAKSSGNLKAVFIEKAAYVLPLMADYPCVLLQRTFDQSFGDFVKYFQRVFQDQADDGDTWFWLGLAILSAYFDIPLGRSRVQKTPKHCS